MIPLNAPLTLFSLRYRDWAALAITVGVTMGFAEALAWLLVQDRGSPADTLGCTADELRHRCRGITHRCLPCTCASMAIHVCDLSVRNLPDGLGSVTTGV
jgi:hypothetical protein